MNEETFFIEQDIRKLKKQVKNSGTADLTAINLKLNNNIKRTEYFYGFRDVKPIVSFLSDDSPIEDYNIYKQISIDTGVPFTLAVITNKASDDVNALFSDVNISKLHELVDVYGYEVASHTHDHSHLDALTYAQQEYQLKTSKEKLIEKGFEPHSIVYPFGSQNADTLKLTPNYYECGYLAGTNNINDSPLTTFKIDRIQFDISNPNNNLAWYKAKVDSAMANKQWITFMLHSSTAIGWMDATQQQMLKDLIAYIKLNNVEIMTCYNAFKQFKNLNETKDGSCLIGVKGVNIYNNIPTLNSYSLKTLPITDASLLSVFPLGISYKTFTLAQAFPFPGSSAGSLKTYNLGAISQSYQEWHNYNTKDIYWRNYNDSTGLWNAWDTSLPMTGVPYKFISLDFGTIPAQSCTEQSVTVTGCGTTYIAIANPLSALPTGLIFSCNIVSADTVVIRMANVTTAPIVSGGRNWTVKAIKY